MNDLKLELMVANKAFRESEESLDKLRKDYNALREHTNKLEATFREHGIAFPRFWGW